MKTTIISIAVILLSLTTAHATLWIVDQGGSGDFKAIQDAIDAAASGDEILVNAGTYDENLDYLGKSLWIHSASGPNATTIDGSHGAGGQSSCVVFRSGESGAILEGFRLRRGMGTQHQGNLFGGAIFCSGSFFTLRDCWVVENTVTANGAGIQFVGGGADVIDCVFRHNNAQNYGGAISGSYCTVLIERCAFAYNTAVNGDGTVSFGEAALVELHECEFRHNTARAGAGLNIGHGSVVCNVYDCVFDGNQAKQLHGGGVRSHEGSPIIEGCLFVDNWAYLDGGGLMAIDGGQPRLTNCTFFRNGAGRYGGNIAIWDYAFPVLDRCIIAGAATNGGVFCERASAAVLCCDAWENAGGNYIGIDDPTGILGNISADPIFCDVPAGDFTIRSDSPCAEENNPECGQIGAYGVGCYSPQVAEDFREAQDPSHALLLLGNTPNPFGRFTSITYMLLGGQDGSAVTLNVYDAAGRLVNILVNGSQGAGLHHAIWDGADEAGNHADGGVYFYRLTMGDESITKRMILVQ